mgnify:CR=1 FL=1
MCCRWFTILLVCWHIAYIDVWFFSELGFFTVGDPVGIFVRIKLYIEELVYLFLVEILGCVTYIGLKYCQLLI